MFSGAGSAINWVVYGFYVSKCASQRNKGLFNGYVWILFNLAFFLASVLGGSLVGVNGYLTFYTVIPIITMTAMLYFCGLPDTDPVEDDDDQ